MAKYLNNILGMDARTVPKSDTAWAGSDEYIGVEIEVENFTGDPQAVWPFWQQHIDNSLRNGVEFVFAGPRAGSELTSAINAFFDAGFTYDMSPRTSTHIHINATNMITPGQFRSWLTLMYLIEPAVFRWADENRKWCGYCAPLTEIPPRRMVTILTSDDDSELLRAIGGETNQDRYFGLNVAALRRHGTLEFRYFPCTTDRRMLADWIQFVMETKLAGVRFENMADILAAVGDSAESLDSFLRTSFPRSYNNIRQNLDYEDAVMRRTTLLSLSDGPVVWSEAVSARGNLSVSMTRLLVQSYGFNSESLATPAPDDCLRRLLEYYSSQGFGVRMLKNEVDRYITNETLRASYAQWAESNAHLAETYTEAANHDVVEEVLSYYAESFAAGGPVINDREEDDDDDYESDEREEF